MSRFALGLGEFRGRVGIEDGLSTLALGFEAGDATAFAGGEECKVNLDGFRSWLEVSGKTVANIRTLLSDVKRVGREYGDLVRQYEADRLEGIMASLRYTASEQRQGRPNPSKLDVKGNLASALGPYRTATALYRRFLDSAAGDHPPNVGEEAHRGLVEGEQQWFGLERDLQAALRARIEELESGLVVVDNGVERSVDSGLIDIMARDIRGSDVVVELKAGRAGQRAIAQILSYMGDVASEEGKDTVRGILVAGDFDAKARAAARMVPTLTLIRYAIQFRFSDGNA